MVTCSVGAPSLVSVCTLGTSLIVAHVEALGDLTEQRVARAAAARRCAAGDEEHLGAAGVGRPGVRHGQRPDLVAALRRGARRGSCSRTAPCSTGRRTGSPNWAAKSVHDAEERRAVVEVVAGEHHEVVDGLGCRLRVELDGHRPLRGLERRRVRLRSGRCTSAAPRRTPWCAPTEPSACGHGVGPVERLAGARPPCGWPPGRRTRRPTWSSDGRGRGGGAVAGRPSGRRPRRARSRRRRRATTTATIAADGDVAAAAGGLGGLLAGGVETRAAAGLLACSLVGAHEAGRYSQTRPSPAPCAARPSVEGGARSAPVASAVVALLVQKFGGTSVGDPERIREVADHVARCRRRGDEVVLVVSAMGKETDELLRLARRGLRQPVPAARWTC